MHTDNYYRSQHEETELSELEVVGALPKWISGKLVRNGPALFEAGSTKLRHWFDGYGLLHAFTIADGGVRYQSKFIASQEYLSAKANGKNLWVTWGTASDPCRSIFRRFMTSFTRTADNTPVSVMRNGKRYYTTSDVGVLNEFDVTTLDTLSTKAVVRRGVMAAHPAFASDGSVWNMQSVFGPRGANTFIKVAEDGAAVTHTSFATPKTYYFHSFANTERYLVSIEQPMYLSFARLLGSGIFKRSYYECFSWDAAATNTLHVLDRQTGTVAHIKTPHRFFYFHTINTFEKDGELVIDLCGYDNKNIIDDFYLDTLRTTGIPQKDKARVMRLSVSLDSQKTKIQDFGFDLELPNINHRYGGREYRFAYGIQSNNGSPNLSDSIAKWDVGTQTTKTWYERGVIPGEPIFIEHRNETEDDGVIASVCHDEKDGKTFLLVLDAKSMTEIARAYVPNHIPASLHGAFYAEAKS